MSCHVPQEVSWDTPQEEGSWDPPPRVPDPDPDTNNHWTDAGFPTQREPKPRGPYQCRATQLSPAWNILIPGEPVALDIEFQTFKHSSWPKWRHRVGRVAIVNSKGETVLDVYAAYPKEDGVVKRVPPAQFMVNFQDLKYDNGAVNAHKVEHWVKEILQDRTVIVHGGTHDLTAFTIETDVYDRSRVMDTQFEYSHLQFDGKPTLRTAAAMTLGETIQEESHSPVEDAQTAMKLWLRKYTYDRDAELAKLGSEANVLGDAQKGKHSDRNNKNGRGKFQSRRGKPESKKPLQSLPVRNPVDAVSAESQPVNNDNRKSEWYPRYKGQLW